jgi:hypothetical protein
MTSQYRHRRTSNPATPAPTPLEPGEIQVNTANRQLSVGDAASATLGQPKALLGVRVYDAAAIYAAGDLVVFTTTPGIYQAVRAAGPGYNGADWTPIAASGLWVSKAGDTMTGALNGTQFNATGGGGYEFTLTNGIRTYGLAVAGGSNNFTLDDITAGASRLGITPAGAVTIPGPLLGASSITSGNGGATGQYLFGNTGGKYLNFDGTEYNLIGGTLNVGANLAVVGSVYSVPNPTTGTYQFGNSGVKYLQYDGTNFLLAGGPLRLSAYGNFQIGGLPATAGVVADGSSLVGLRAYSGGGISMQSAGGAANYGVFSASGLSVTGTVSATGNVTATGGVTATGALTGASASISGAVTSNGLQLNAGSANFVIGGGTIAQGGGSTMMVQGAGGGNETFMTFHRPGSFACNFGLGADNNFWMGGWSFGAGQQYRFWTTKDFASLPSMTPGVTDVRLAMAADYAHTAVGVTEPYLGAVTTGGSPVVSGSYYYSRYRWLQVNNGGWYTVGTA